MIRQARTEPCAVQGAASGRRPKQQRTAPVRVLGRNKVSSPAAQVRARIGPCRFPDALHPWLPIESITNQHCTAWSQRNFNTTGRLFIWGKLREHGRMPHYHLGAATPPGFDLQRYCLVTLDRSTDESWSIQDIRGCGRRSAESLTALLQAWAPQTDIVVSPHWFQLRPSLQQPAAVSGPLLDAWSAQLGDTRRLALWTKIDSTDQLFRATAVAPAAPPSLPLDVYTVAHWERARDGSWFLYQIRGNRSERLLEQLHAPTASSGIAIARHREPPVSPRCEERRITIEQLPDLTCAALDHAAAAWDAGGVLALLRYRREINRGRRDGIISIGQSGVQHCSKGECQVTLVRDQHQRRWIIAAINGTHQRALLEELRAAPGLSVAADLVIREATSYATECIRLRSMRLEEITADAVKNWANELNTPDRLTLWGVLSTGDAQRYLAVGRGRPSRLNRAYFCIELQQTAGQWKIVNASGVNHPKAMALLQPHFPIASPSAP